MLCYLVRHGIAADAEQFEGSDFDRPLTDKGRKQMSRVGKRLAGLELDIKTIVTSPLLRAKQTAEIVAGALGAKDRIVEDARLGGGFDARAFASIVREYGDRGDVMLVGHEPSMSAVLSDAIGGGRIDFKKGAVGCIELFEDAPSGTLRWLVTPKTLGAL